MVLKLKSDWPENVTVSRDVRVRAQSTRVQCTHNARAATQKDLFPVIQALATRPRAFDLCKIKGQKDCQKDGDDNDARTDEKAQRERFGLGSRSRLLPALRRRPVEQRCGVFGGHACGDEMWVLFVGFEDF